MHLDLSHLRQRADEHVDRIFEPAAFAAESSDGEYRVVAPVHLVVDVHKDGDVYRITGRVETRLELDCSRCLEPFEAPIESAFELRYVPFEQNAGDEEREIAEDDLTTAYYKDQTVDLGALMREQFQLALPMKPLCAEDCKGLCAECGANLNKTTCGCAPKWEDPRLVALKGMLKVRKDI